MSEEEKLITVIGRGHSGTRAMSHTLTASGVYMGEPLNHAGDLLPPDDLYEACRVIGRYVDHRGGTSWDFSKLQAMPIDPAFTRLLDSYLASVWSSDVPWRGWKLPETTLIYPWLRRLHPDIHYIYWIRDPRDCILGRHLTDDMERVGIPHDPVEDVYQRRAISWKYQVEIVKTTPRPERFLTVRFEDFVMRQEETLRQVGDFLGIELATIEVRPEAVGRHTRSGEPVNLPVFADDLVVHGYA